MTSIDTNGTNETNGNGLLAELSAGLAGLAKQVAPTVVRVEDGSRLTATGLVWSADGLIVTTSHGLERDTDIEIELHDDTRHAATLVGRDNETDIALVRISTDISAYNLVAVRPAGEESVAVGALAMALGRPGRGGLQATLGLISGRIDTEREGNAEYLLHTDALLYPGFSGGGLFATDGSLLGMIDLLYGRGKGIALGVPIIARSVAALLHSGKVQRPYLGIRTQQAALPVALRESLQLESEHGLLVIQVEPGTSADVAGLTLGDTVLKLNGLATPDVDALRTALAKLQVGQTVDLQVLRGGELRDFQATLGTAG